MCGIAGIYRFDGGPVDTAVLRRMADAIRHRGPDDQGVHVDGQVGLGHRRLSIIDLSPRGRQPMSNEDGSIWISFNGEIYNYQELRVDLIKHGHRFRSDTDTEAIVHLYEEEGVNCLRRLNGMFAFALWDSRARRLLLARDRLGIKPLFYYQDGDKLLFGSEIKSILCDPSVDRQVNVEALHHFLSFNYMAAPLTMFQGVRQLLPAHYLVVEEGRVSVTEYWDLRFPDGGPTHKDSYYLERVEELFKRAVRRMLVSDVPFGAFLSGGLDSSAVTTFMSQMLEQPVNTFSIGFAEATYSELDYARLVARHCATRHHEQIVSPDTLPDLLPRLVWHGEEPTADASMVPVYYVSRLARQHVTMVLSGDGSDEIFAGYETYTAYYAGDIYRRLPLFLRRRIISELVKRLPVSNAKLSFRYKAGRFVRGANFAPEQGHFYWRLILDEDQKRALYADRLERQLQAVDTFQATYARYFQKTTARDPLNRLLYVDTRFYLPNDMLVKVDRMSMANSLEVRVPFLDHELVECLAEVPPSLKLRYFVQTKYLLKSLMRNRLPHRVVHRQKQGFNIPVGAWIREPLRSFVQDILSDAGVRRMGFFKPAAVRQLLSDHFTRKADYGYEIWGLLVFVLWWEAFIEGKQVGTLVEASSQPSTI
jgi:asparagine synthase (glutamine-hydrolysing)